MFCFYPDGTVFKEWIFDTFLFIYLFFNSNLYFNTPSGINSFTFNHLVNSSHLLPVLRLMILKRTFIGNFHHIHRCCGRLLESKWAKKFPGKGNFWPTISSACRIDSILKSIQQWTMHLSHPFPLGYAGHCFQAIALLKGISVKSLVAASRFSNVTNHAGLSVYERNCIWG